MYNKQKNRGKILKNKKQKVLLIKLSSLGDVIFNIPLANRLKENDFEVSWLVSEKGVSILKNNPCVDKVILLPIEKWKKSGHIFQNIKEAYSILHDIRKENYDIVLDTQMRLKSLFWTKFSKAKRKIISKSAKELSIFGANEFIPKFNHDHAIEKYLEYATYLNLKGDDIKLSLPESTPEIIEKVDGLLKDLDLTKPIILIAPATTWIGKHWNKENWKTLVSKLDDKNYNIIFTGTNNDIELIEYINQGKYLNLAGKTSLKELIELFRRTKLLLSLDSGSTHLAYATQIPSIVSIFMCTPKEFYAPIGKKYIGVQSSVCKPCHHKKCPLTNKYACTTSPTVEEIYRAIQFLLHN